MIRMKSRKWNIAERHATSEHVFLNRRSFITGCGVALAGAAGASILTGCSSEEPPQVTQAPDATTDLFPVDRNPDFDPDVTITSEDLSSKYNNFIEFGSHKRIHDAAQSLPIRPWEVRFDGEVEKDFTIGVEELIRSMDLEERVYRHRCVETWSMIVPWTGFAMKSLVDFAKPLSTAKYVQMETFLLPDVARGQRASWYPWPYTEALTIPEATNELAFLVTGAYGKPLPKQFGSPLRLHLPWKYGFKSIKSIVRFHFARERPKTFWEEINADEYGFWANVNPNVPHPRWSQETEKLLGTSERIPTKIYNGYGEQVAHLYDNLQDQLLFR